MSMFQNTSMMMGTRMLSLVVLLMVGSVGAWNIVPLKPVQPILSYWTTWYIQNYPTMVPKGSDAMGDKNLFATQPSSGCPDCGWAAHFFEASRSDMLLVLDDTWFVRPSSFATQWQIDPQKFPSESPQSSNWSVAATNLVHSSKSAGWGGLGVWHHSVDLGPTPSALGAQFAHLATAGVGHVKVDGTDLEGVVTATSRSATGGVVRVEHKRSPGAPTNGDTTTNGRAPPAYIAELADLLGKTDVLRTDDIVCQMSIPTCLDRFVQTLAYVWDNNITKPTIDGALAVVAPQDEAYMAAGLSGSLAAMRHPLPQLVGDTRLNGNRNLTRRIDEITRATKWFRLAPPTGAFAYPPGQGMMLVDTVALTDVMTLGKNDTWYSKLWGNPVHQGAPARSTRGLPNLPVVVAADPRYPGVVPFVVASQHPNGAVAVAALGRTLSEHKGWVMPRANVTVFVDDGVAMGPNGTMIVGVFGQFEALTVIWKQKNMPALSTVWMQDLAGDSAVDVTARVAWCSGSLFIPGVVIDSVVTSTQSLNDLSDPGVVVAIAAPSDDHVTHRTTSADVVCPTIPPAPTPPPPQPPSPRSPPPPSPDPITPSELNGTWVQQSPDQPCIDVFVTNDGGDVRVIGHNAGKWTSGTGVVIDDVLDVHCVGPNNFDTHQVGTAFRTKTSNGTKILGLSWKDGFDLQNPSTHSVDSNDVTNYVTNYVTNHVTNSMDSNSVTKQAEKDLAPLHWAIWLKQ